MILILLSLLKIKQLDQIVQVGFVTVLVFVIHEILLYLLYYNSLTNWEIEIGANNFLLICSNLCRVSSAMWTQFKVQNCDCRDLVTAVT